VSADGQSNFSEFKDEVISGLSEDAKSLPCRWFYDSKGSELFEAITTLPEYYLTRTETGILRANTDKIANWVEMDSVLLEYGAGASVKTRILLDTLPTLAAYIPIDVAEEFLLKTVSALNNDYPDLLISPLVSDFTDSFRLPEYCNTKPCVGFFPGSTIGNMQDRELTQFFKSARANLGNTAKFILGADLIKSPDVLLQAYNDGRGVTAQFNKNLLRRINHELDANFNLNQFDHKARWNADASQIEMYLLSLREQKVEIGEHSIRFAEGELIHTESSRKFSVEQLNSLCNSTGWSVEECLFDSNKYFTVLLMCPLD